MSVLEFSEADIERAQAHVRTLAAPRVVADDIAESVAELYGITRQALFSPCRDGLHVEARRAVYTRLRAAGWSYPMIGRFAGRDHTSVMWALGAIVKSADRGRLRRGAGR